jgi:flagellar basal body-associated protein FliL
MMMIMMVVVVIIILVMMMMMMMMMVTGPLQLVRERVVVRHQVLHPPDGGAAALDARHTDVDTESILKTSTVNESANAGIITNLACANDRTITTRA